MVGGKKTKLNSIASKINELTNGTTCVFTEVYDFIVYILLIYRKFIAHIVFFLLDYL